MYLLFPWPGLRPGLKIIDNNAFPPYQLFTCPGPAPVLDRAEKNRKYPVLPRTYFSCFPVLPRSWTGASSPSWVPWNTPGPTSFNNFIFGMLYCMLKMVDERRSNFYVVSTIILCDANFCVLYWSCKVHIHTIGLRGSDESLHVTCSLCVASPRLLSKVKRGSNRRGCTQAGGLRLIRFWKSKLLSYYLSWFKSAKNYGRSYRKVRPLPVWHLLPKLDYCLLQL